MSTGSSQKLLMLKTERERLEKELRVRNADPVGYSYNRFSSNEYMKLAKAFREKSAQIIDIETEAQIKSDTTAFWSGLIKGTFIGVLLFLGVYRFAEYRKNQDRLALANAKLSAIYDTPSPHFEKKTQFPATFKTKP